MRWGSCTRRIPMSPTSTAPIVRIVCAPDGSLVPGGPLIDLGEAGGTTGYKRSIIKVTDPGKYGIEPSDYFV